MLGRYARKSPVFEDMLYTQERVRGGWAEPRGLRRHGIISVQLPPLRLLAVRRRARRGSPTPADPRHDGQAVDDTRREDRPSTMGELPLESGVAIHRQGTKCVFVLTQ